MGPTSSSPSGGALGWLRSRFAWLLLLAGIVLLFADLPDVYLWQDEAETGVIARHVLTYGLPLSTDGRDWVQQAPEAFQEFNQDYIWTYHPWLQYLAAAASFAILGMTTFAARFPFALAGLATLLALYHFVSRWLGDSLTARVAGVLLLLCVPFIVLMRQCRYYAPSALFTLLTVDSYLWLRSDKPWAVPYFVLSAVLLFHSFYVAFFPTLAALVAHWFLTRASRAKRRDPLGEAGRRPPSSAGLGSVLCSVSGANDAWPEPRTARGVEYRMPGVRFLFALLLIVLLTLPWTTLIPAWRDGSSLLSTIQQTVQPFATDAADNAGRSTNEAAATGPQQPAWTFALASLGQYFLYITLWIFPLTLGLVWFVAWLVSRRRRWLVSRRRLSRAYSGPAHPAYPAGRSPAQNAGCSSDSGDAGWSTDVTGDERQPAEIGGPGGPGSRAKRTAFCQVVGLVIAANLVAISFVDCAFFRYLTHLMPLLLALLAVAVVWFIERWPVVGYALLFLLVTSNSLHAFPYLLLKAAVPEQSPFWPAVRARPATEWIDQTRAVRLRSDLWMYGQELTQAYQGPNEGLVAYLSAHATPGQTVLVNYEDLPLQFYTKLHVLGGLSAHGLTPDLRPDWVIDRRYGPYRDLLADILAAGSYERITIPFPDIRWENREEARQHQFLTVQDADPVILYRWQGG
jgi:hypothetical protein